MNLEYFFEKILKKKPLVTDIMISGLLEEWTASPIEIKKNYQGKDQLIRLLLNYDPSSLCAFVGFSFRKRIDIEDAKIIFGLFNEDYISINLNNGIISIDDIENETTKMFATTSSAFFEVLLILNELFQYHHEKKNVDINYYVKKLCEEAGTDECYDEFIFVIGEVFSEIN